MSREGDRYFAAPGEEGAAPDNQKVAHSMTTALPKIVEDVPRHGYLSPDSPEIRSDLHEVTLVGEEPRLGQFDVAVAHHANTQSNLPLRVTQRKGLGLVVTANRSPLLKAHAFLRSFAMCSPVWSYKSTVSSSWPYRLPREDLILPCHGENAVGVPRSDAVSVVKIPQRRTSPFLDIDAAVGRRILRAMLLPPSGRPNILTLGARRP